MRFRFFYRTILILVLSVFCLFSTKCYAENEVQGHDKPAPIKSEDGAVDPTIARANNFIGKKPSEAYEHYRRLEDKFTKNLVREDRIAFNRWWSGVSSPFFIAAWKKEWQEHPESHVAFALYIRDEVKRSRHLRNIEELSPSITDDEKLFNNYLDYNKQVNKENIQEQSSLEKRLHIPSELKAAAQNPEAYLFLVGVYKNYVVTQSNRALEEKWKQQEAIATAARKAIVPVDRNSREYQDAFLSYKKAVANEKQETLTAQKNDPTWARAQYLLKVKDLGTIPVMSGQEREFTKGFDKAERDQFNQWKKCFDALTSIDTVEQEWKKEPHSHRAIIFVANIARTRIRLKEEGKAFDYSSVDVKEMLKGDKTTVEEYSSFLRQSVAESLSQMEFLEKSLRISSKLKTAIKASVSDSTLFLFYDTYFRTFTPDNVKQAEQDVREAIAKLNALRPNWAAEERIEFSDKR